MTRQVTMELALRISLRSLMLLLWTLCVTACQAGDAGETQLKTLQSILAKGGFSKRVSNREAPTGFCDALLRDLEAGRNAKVVEPIIETNDPKDPRLAKYEACAAHDFTAENEKRGGPSPDAFEGLSGSLAVVGDRNFKWFPIEPDGSSRPADEILYGEWSREGRAEGRRYGGYRVIDTKQCMVTGFAPVEQEPLEKNVRSDYVERMNFLLIYGNDYFVLNLKDVMVYNRQRPEQEPLYSIILYKYDAAQDYKLRQLCVAKQPLPKWAR